MSANGSTDFLFNSTSVSESNCTSYLLFECTESFLGMILTGFATLFNTVFALPLSAWILWLARKSGGVTSSDFIIFNQSVVEVIANSSIIVFILGSIFDEKIVIYISSYLCCTLVVGRPLFQTFYCVERYLAVVHPLVYLKYMKTPKIKLSFVGLVWLSILLFGWFLKYSYPRIPRLYIGQLIIMLVVCSFCSVMILRVLKRPKPGDREEKEAAYQQKRKAFVAVTVILIILLFGYGTVSCAILLRDHVPYDTYCLVLCLSWCTLVPSALVQPYLYLSKIGKLQCINKAIDHNCLYLF